MRFSPLVISTIFMVTTWPSSLQAGQTMTIPLPAADTDVKGVTTTAPIASKNFHVDSTTTKIIFEVISTSQRLRVTLTTPQGNMLDSVSVSALGGTFRQFVIEQPGILGLMPFLTLPGTHYIFELQDPSPGSYILQVDGTSMGESAAVAIFNMVSNSTVRAALRTNSPEYPFGRAQQVILLGPVFDGTTPVVGATFKATVFSATPSGQLASLPLVSVLLQDDGHGFDAVGGDGIYGGVISVTQSGKFVIVGEISGEIVGKGRFDRKASTTFFVNEPLARLTGGLRDTGLDDDGDGLLDRVQLTIEINATKAGRYALRATLLGSNEASVSRQHSVSLLPGVQQVTVDFPVQDLRRLGVSGPYFIRDLMLEFLDGARIQLADRLLNSAQTQAYQLAALQQAPITLTGAHSDFGTDTNGNGRFDLLTVRVEVNLLASGLYTWTGRLMDGNDQDIDFATNSSELQSGLSTVSLVFNGRKIALNGVNGPYFVREFTISNPDATFTSAVPISTQAYQVSAFETQRPPVAKTGHDQTVAATRTDTFCGATIRLDGTGSFDPDGDPLTYTWLGPFAGTQGRVSGISTSVQLPFGVHTLTLFVNDGFVDSAPARMTVTIPETTPPSTSATASPLANQAGWNNTDVTVQFAATDDCAGVRELHYQIGTASEVVLKSTIVTLPFTTEGIFPITYFSIDQAGNREAARPLTIRVDKAQPTITAFQAPPANLHGWNHTDVTVRFEGTDTLSGIATLTPPVLLTAEGKGQVVVGTATDLAGNTAALTRLVSIDRTVPTLTLSRFEPIYIVNSLVAATASATDALSGPAGLTLTLNGVSLQDPLPLTPQGQSFAPLSTTTTGATTPPTPVAYWLSSVIGDGRPGPGGNPFRPALSRLLSRWMAVLPAQADGRPKFPWTLVTAFETITSADPGDVLLPPGELDAAIALTPKKLDRLKAELAKRGIPTASVTADMTLRSLLLLIGRTLDPAYTPGTPSGPPAVSSHTTLFYDDFNRTDRDLNGDNHWAEFGGSGSGMTIVNQEVQTKANSDSTVRNTTALGTQDHFVGVDYLVAGTANHLEGPIARSATNGTQKTYYWFYGLFEASGGRWILTKRVNDNETNLAERAVGAHASRPRLVLEVTGSTIRGYENGVLQITATDSDLAGGDPGMHDRVHPTHTALFDHFKVATTLAEANDPEPPVVLTALTVTPAAPTLSVGQTLSFTATGTYSDGTTRILTDGVTWTSSTPAVATIAPTGLATALDLGTTLITATSGAITGSTTLTVVRTLTLTKTLTLAAAGLTTLTATATDFADNVATESRTFKVCYAFGGFLPPLDRERLQHAGRVLPVKFQLRDATGAFISTAQARLWVAPVVNGLPQAEQAAAFPGQSQKNGLFKYDPDEHQYHFNWDTSPLMVGLWQIRVDLGDGCDRTLQVRLRDRGFEVVAPEPPAPPPTAPPASAPPGPQPPSSNTLLQRADLDGNGRVDGRDLMLLARAIGSRPGSPRWQARFDLNGDGRVDRADLQLLRSQFGKRVVRR